MSMTVKVQKEICCSEKEGHHEVRTHFSSARDFLILLAPIAIAVGATLAGDEHASALARLGVFLLLVATLSAGLAVLSGVEWMEKFEKSSRR